jgi:hypothetical protein
MRLMSFSTIRALRGLVNTVCMYVYICIEYRVIEYRVIEFPVIYYPVIERLWHRGIAGVEDG